MVRKYLKSSVDTNGKWALVSKCIRRDGFLRLLREWNARKFLFCQMINLSMYQSLSFLFGMERSLKRNWILEKKCGEAHNAKESLNLTGWCCIWGNWLAVIIGGPTNIAWFEDYPSQSLRLEYTHGLCKRKKRKLIEDA